MRCPHNIYCKWKLCSFLICQPKWVNKCIGVFSIYCGRGCVILTIFLWFAVSLLKSCSFLSMLQRITEAQNKVVITDRMWARLLSSTNQPSFLSTKDIEDSKKEKEPPTQLLNGENSKSWICPVKARWCREVIGVDKFRQLLQHQQQWTWMLYFSIRSYF